VPSAFADFRFGYLTMTDRYIHLHGYALEIAGTDGNWIPKGERWPEVTSDVAVGQMRGIEFTANRPGDWAVHCYKSLHTMNAMGHQVPNMIGMPKRDLAKRINNLVPDYMAMGSTGGAMGGMEMPLFDDTRPMMTGRGPFGPLEMDGMFTVVKVREGLGHSDYGDPGWYAHPQGTFAYEYTG
jgi:hypothetical protein